MVNNGVTTPFVFARFFSKAACKNLLHPKHGIGKIRVIVEEWIKAFHHWLQTNHNEGEDLMVIDLSRFSDDQVETHIEEDHDKGSGCGQGGVGSKESGHKLPSFNGDQQVYEVWCCKMRAFLYSMHNNEGILLYYVIADLKEEEPEFQKKCKDVKNQGKLYDRDDFRVAQWFESALAEGLAHIYVKKYAGDARYIYKDLEEVF